MSVRHYRCRCGAQIIANDVRKMGQPRSAGVRLVPLDHEEQPSTPRESVKEVLDKWDVQTHGTGIHGECP